MALPLATIASEYDDEEKTPFDVAEVFFELLLPATLDSAAAVREAAHAALEDLGATDVISDECLTK